MTSRFLCDEMLKRLGRWLRVAGYDVVILPDGTDDRTLMQRAREENRLLLTRDRHMSSQTAGAGEPLLLSCNDLDNCVDALNRRLDIDWLHAPFTRCMNCNTPLRDADPSNRTRVPQGALSRASMVKYCPRCDQLFWDGSHVERMRARLESWNRGRGSRG